MKIRWILLMALAAVLVLSFALDDSSAYGEDSDDSDISPDDDDSDDWDDDDDDDDDPTEWFEIDDITYIPTSDHEVMANQCFKQTPDVVVPPMVTYDGVTYIVRSISVIFICTDIETLTIPYTVEDIDGSLICPTLRAIYVDDDNLVYESRDGVLYTKGLSILLKYPSAKEGDSFITPASVTGLGDYCFEGCEQLENIILPNNIYSIPTRAFYDCKNLSHINFNGVRNKLPSTIRMIDDDAFTGCESLQQIDLPDQMTYIGYFAFSNSGLTSFKVPSFVSYIGMGAFNGCKNLAWIDSNSSTYYTIDGVLVETIGMDETIHTYPDRPDEVYEIPERITKIAPMAFGNTTHLKEVKLSPNMSMINARAFYNCESLERIEIPEYIFKIEEMAFYNCKNLKEVILDEGLIRIGYDAFQNSGIETITIPSSVKYLDDYAFCGCELLRQIDIYSDEVIMNECLFDMCPSLVEINIYGANITTNEFTFTSIYNEETIIIHTQKGVKLEGIPFDSNIVVKHFGERPYPWENLIGVFVCVMVLIFVFRNIRGV